MTVVEFAVGLTTVWVVVFFALTVFLPTGAACSFCGSKRINTYPATEQAFCRACKKEQ